MAGADLMKTEGLILKCLGGLYTVLADDKAAIPEGILLSDGGILCRARGVLRHEGVTPLIGDRVVLDIDVDIAIDSVLPRKNSLIRPPLANIDFLFIVFSPSEPDPDLCYIDKLTCICEHSGIEPVIVISKSNTEPQAAQSLCDIYKKCGFFAFCEDKDSKASIDAIKAFIAKECKGKICAFAGVSGVGKSTLLNSLFGTLYAETGEISKKIGRGKHTTRHVELYPVSVFENEDDFCFFADTPGFSMLDFTRFDFLSKEELPRAFREFAPRLFECRYTDCTHTKETECGITAGVRNGEIPKSRHESFIKIREELKQKKLYK